MDTAVADACVAGGVAAGWVVMGATDGVLVPIRALDICDSNEEMAEVKGLGTTAGGGCEVTAVTMVDGALDTARVGNARVGTVSPVEGTGRVVGSSAWERMELTADRADGTIDAWTMDGAAAISDKMLLTLGTLVAAPCAGRTLLTRELTSLMIAGRSPAGVGVAAGAAVVGATASVV